MAKGTRLPKPQGELLRLSATHGLRGMTVAGLAEQKHVEALESAGLVKVIERDKKSAGFNARIVITDSGQDELRRF